MKKKFFGKVAIGVLALSLVGTGVYAGTVISTYKTARGDYATVEKEEVHKNRIALNVDGTKMKTQSWYANGVTYVPMREAAEMLGATVNYNTTTQTAEITSKAAHPPLDIIKQEDLPFTLNDRGLIFTFNKVKADLDGITFNVTVTNSKNNTADATISSSSWSLYGNNKTIKYLGIDDFLYNHYFIKPGETVSGEVYFSALPSDVDLLTLDLNLRVGYSDKNYLLRIEAK